ncbi:hypothetical protein BDZ94DRAFT_1247395, partial [Collybia nuda]
MKWTVGRSNKPVGVPVFSWEGRISRWESQSLKALVVELRFALGAEAFCIGCRAVG